MSTQTSAVIKQILDYIRTNQLIPGDPMPSEPALVEQLGVSRSTLREAVRELRTLQIIEVRHGFGSFVGEASLSFLSEALVFRTMAPGQPPAKGMLELIAIRKMLEVSLAEQVTGKLSDDQIERLYACCNKMTDDSDNAHVDRLFHSILYEQVDNEIVKQLISAFWDAFDQIKTQLPNEGIQATHRIHKAIVDAYLHDNKEAARKAMADHFEFIQQRLHVILEQES
ncbi:MAG: FadR/GntR family transcriptional regulator [Actinomycetaceae bacterium]|nr:FadR/GntR family transcriptional regulator [Actinomycetaceae bacterium]